MPTDRPRHAITETPEIAAALAVAARRWPADRDRPALLLRRLVTLGADAAAEDDRTGVESRRRAIAETSGAFTGLYGDHYLDELRDEWPD